MTISKEQLTHALNLRDLTNLDHGRHAMQIVLNEILSALQSKWQNEVRIERGSAVVPVADNYDRLYYPPQGQARGKRYTRYVTADTILRTQMSAVIPNALHSVSGSDTLLACPGLVYRRDVKDSLHVGEPHQLDLWRICKNKELNDNDLISMIETIVGAALPGWVWRGNKTNHPYTLNGIEIEVQHPKTKEWIEIGECGLALPALLTDNGLDQKQWSGLAMGLGLDRLLMLRKGIDDIRLLRSTDKRVVSQMNDLSPYQPVSRYPEIKRDLSLAVSSGILLEEITDKLEMSLTPNEWEQIEVLELLSQTPAAKLPDIARERIGLSLEQDNILLRIVIRHSTKSLTKQEGNTLRDRCYEILHEGAVKVMSN